MITELEILRFKAWKEAGPIRLAPITALFGTNSSGKSSILQLLLMLKQTTDSPDRAQPLNLGGDRSLVELGTFSELLYRHDLRQTLMFGLHWRLPEELAIGDPSQKGEVLLQGSDMGLYADVAWKEGAKPGSGRAAVDYIAYHFGGGLFFMKARSDGRGYDLVSQYKGFDFVRARGRPWGLPAPSRCYGFPDEVRAYYQNAGFLSDFELEFEKLFGRVFYLGPLREHPQRQYTWAGARPEGVGTRGERVVDALIAAREEGATIRRGRGKKKLTLEERVALWLKELGLIDSFEVRSVAPGNNLYRVLVKRSPGSPEVLLTDVGFGVSQILPVLTLCYYAPEGSTLILEQPEIHLHPSVQAGLADVFIDAINTRKIQIILESHSEHLLRRLQRRIAEETLQPHQAALYFCAVKGGESRLDELEVDPYGNIRNWPKDFFGEEFGEIAAMSEAIIERKRSDAQ